MKKNKLSNLLFNDKEKYFLSSYYNIVYFIIVNILFYNVVITAHYSMGVNYLYFFIYLALVINISVIMNVFKKVNSYFIILFYNVLYIIFSVIFGAFQFDIILLVIINMFCIFSIKIFKYIRYFNNNIQDVELEIINYSIINDFNSEMAYHKYNIPFVQSIEKTREINEEIDIIEIYNKKIKSNLKIENENFNKFKNKMSFNIPKSLLLTIYKIILDYSVENIENEAISFKLTDNTGTIKSNKGNYVFEFKTNKNNLNKAKIDDKFSTIKTSIEEIITICEKNSFNLKIKQGISKEQYLIRVNFELEEIENKNELPNLLLTDDKNNNNSKEIKNKEEFNSNIIEDDCELTKDDIDTFNEIDFK